MKRQQFLDAVRQSLELPELAPDEHGVCSIVFDGDLEIELAPLTETRLLMRSRVGAVPDDEAEHEAFLRGLLQRNLANQHSQQGVLSLDQEAKAVWFYRLLDLPTLEERGVADVVGDFVNSAEWWSQSGGGVSPMEGLPFSMLRP